MNTKDKILEILDNYPRTFVGILCKRIEILDKEGVLTPSLYKAILKENIYELFRHLKDKIEVILTIGTVNFKENKKPKNSEKE